MKTQAEHISELEAAIDRVRKMHPRGDEERHSLTPGLYCPGCGEPRENRGMGGCRTRDALALPTRQHLVVIAAG